MPFVYLNSFLLIIEVELGFFVWLGRFGVFYIILLHSQPFETILEEANCVPVKDCNACVHSSKVSYVWLAPIIQEVRFASMEHLLP